MTTANCALITPSTGSLPGAWGEQAVNPNMVALDGLLRGAAVVSLANSNVTLTAPPGSIVPSPGPNQSQNALIQFTGMISANIEVAFPLPGPYYLLNSCTGNFYVRAKGGSGNVVGLPPGQAVTIFSNGTDMSYISLPPPGSYWDYAGGSVPAWIGACTVAPWKACDGSILNIADWPQLYAIVGAAYGGNGLTTFGLPDFRNRAFYMLDTGTPTNRITTAGSGIGGTTLGASGGDQLMQQHLHTITDPGHPHKISNSSRIDGTFQTSGGSVNGINMDGGSGVTINTAVTGISVNNAGSGASQNMPPALIGGIKFIRMG